jgi:hypothetical protein
MQKSFEPTTIQSEFIEPKSIEQIRKTGIDQEILNRIAAEKAEMDRRSEEAKSRLFPAQGDEFVQPTERG